MLRPLGMSKVRSKRLRQMSKDFLTWDGRDALDLHGIGKYGIAMNLTHLILQWVVIFQMGN